MAAQIGELANLGYALDWRRSMRCQIVTILYLAGHNFPFDTGFP
jgi:hypothetical protein